MLKTNSTNIGFVLLHGAGLGAWIWDDLLKKIDYPSLVIDLPGRGKHIHIENKRLPLEGYVKSVLSDIDKFDRKKLVIVSHSISGIIGLELVRLLQNRIFGFMAIGACIPPVNNSYISSLPFFTGMFLRIMFLLSGTKPPRSVIRNSLCNDLSDELALKVINRFVPESKKIYTDKPKFRNTPIKSVYIRLRKDKAFDEPLQDRMIANLNGTQVIDIDSGHLPMLSKPDELANTLNSFGNKINKWEQRRENK